MKVTVEDDRVFPEYQCTPIMTLIRATLNENGHDWNECITIANGIQAVLKDADYISDDYGITWARVDRSLP